MAKLKSQPLYFIQQNLSTSFNDRLISIVVGAGCIGLILVLSAFWHLKPNHGIKPKTIIELDFGAEDPTEEKEPPPPPPPPPSDANSGGGSGTAGNGEKGKGGSKYIPSGQSEKIGGQGKVVHSTDENNSEIPKVKPPATGGATSDPNRKSPGTRNRGTASGGTGDKTNEFDGNGGSGAGGSGGGNNGGNGTGTSGNKGSGKTKGFFDPVFKHYRVQPKVTTTRSNGTGKIIASVQINCDGSFRILNANLRGSTYNGNDAPQQIGYFLKNSDITRIGSSEDCPDQGTITINIINNN